MNRREQLRRRHALFDALADLQENAATLDLDQLAAVQEQAHAAGLSPEGLAAVLNGLEGVANSLDPDQTRIGPNAPRRTP